jgi:hypothetical protein
LISCSLYMSWWMDYTYPSREIYIANIYFIALRSLSNHGRCDVLTSSLVLLETKTRYEFIRNCAYAYALIIWPMNLWNLWKANLFFIGNEHSIDIVSLIPWRLYFDSVCQCAGIAYLSPCGAVFDASCCLGYLPNLIRMNMKLFYSC